MKLPRRVCLELEGVALDAGTIAAGRDPRSDQALWIADVSQVWAGNAWLHFGFVLDGRFGHCLGTHFHRVLHPELISEALAQGLAARPLEAPSVLGSREPAFVLTNRCYSAGIDVPRGNVASAAEALRTRRFITRLRRELLDAQEDDPWTSHPEATAAIDAWITDYNDGLMDSEWASAESRSGQTAGDRKSVV